MLEKKEKEKERKRMLTSKMISDAVARIWANESANVLIIYNVSTSGRETEFSAQCDSICESKRLTESNYERVLNDMFYDYCVENASYMGVS